MQEQIVYKKISELKNNPNNPRKNDNAVDTVAKSIQKYGFRNPLIVDDAGIVWCGNTRLKAAKKLKLKEVPCIVVNDLTEQQMTELALLDNKTNEIAEWDTDVLADILKNVDLSEFDLDWNVDLDIDDIGKEPEEDDFDVDENIPEQPKSKLGDIYQLGNHRIMCGDSTKKEDVELLMNGEKADMVFTDPPYNVDYGSKNEFLNEYDNGDRRQEDIAGDKGMTDEEIGEKLWKPAFQNLRDSAKDDCSIYCTMPQGGAHMMMMMMCSASWQVKHELIWVKNNHVLGRTDYFYKHEPILFGWAKTHKFYGKGEFNKSVWEIDKPSKSDLHPTMKPIRLIANALQNSSKENDLIIDFFGGSGSTLIACEQLNRKCYMMELDPKYVDVIIARWEKLTGQKAEKIN